MLAGSSILQSVEFYVIAVVVAAAVIAVLGRRPSDGPVREVLLPGTLSSSADPQGAAIELVCHDSGVVTLMRHGLRGVHDDGAVSLALEVRGFEVKIRERVVTGREPWALVDTAQFTLDFMGREHYFISYTSAPTPEATELFASLTLSNRPGNRVVKQLQ